MPKIVKITTKISILDLVMPHSCRGCGRTGSPLCERCKKYILSTTTNLCPHCKTPLKLHMTTCESCHKMAYPTYAIGARSGLLDLCIHAYKYDSARALAKPLAELLRARLPENLNNTIIVPLPTSTSHVRARGFDHTMLLAKHLSKLTNCPIDPLLARNKNTVQVGTDKTTRQIQANHAYALSPKAQINPDTTYLLLDDVWTTGASMLAAVEKLRQAGAKRIIIALLAVSLI